jgi:hypothetical protein
MQQSCTYGSVRGASGNRRPYRDKTRSKPPMNADKRFVFYLRLSAFIGG